MRLLVGLWKTQLFSADERILKSNFPWLGATVTRLPIGKSKASFSILGFSFASKRRVHVLIFSLRRMSGHISYSWPLKRQIQMHEGFEYASNKKKEGLIWPTSINKTHSCVVKIVGKSMNEIMKNRWCIYDLRTKYNVLRRRTIPLHWKWKLTLSVWHLLANKTNKHLRRPFSKVKRKSLKQNDY